jgi:hypothetical protein
MIKKHIINQTQTHILEGLNVPLCPSFFKLTHTHMNSFSLPKSSFSSLSSALFAAHACNALTAFSHCSSTSGGFSSSGREREIEEAIAGLRREVFDAIISFADTGVLPFDLEGVEEVAGFDASEFETGFTAGDFLEEEGVLSFDAFGFSFAIVFF